MSGVGLPPEHEHTTDVGGVAPSGNVDASTASSSPAVEAEPLLGAKARPVNLTHDYDTIMNQLIGDCRPVDRDANIRIAQRMINTIRDALPPKPNWSERLMSWIARQPTAYESAVQRQASKVGFNVDLIRMALAVFPPTENRTPADCTRLGGNIETTIQELSGKSIVNNELTALSRRVDTLQYDVAKDLKGERQAEHNQRYNEILATFNGIVNGYRARGISIKSGTQAVASVPTVAVVIDPVKKVIGQIRSRLQQLEESSNLEKAETAKKLLKEIEELSSKPGLSTDRRDQLQDQLELLLMGTRDRESSDAEKFAGMLTQVQ